MKGDFSRIRFNPEKQYTAVLEQQGRVSLDADGNEQQAIDGYLRETTNIDVIGRVGGPIWHAGFAIEVAGDQILIGRGRYYVEGILVENDADLTYDDQPYLIDATYTALELLEEILRGQGDVTAQLYLEVWQRLVTQLDDPCLREPALCQADTTARLQTVWRVVAKLQTSKPTQDPTGTREPVEKEILVNPVVNKTGIGTQLSACCQSMSSVQGQLRTGAMGADTGTGGTDCGCQPIPSAGYQGLENQLYRVEIHTSGTLETATFKWSRENGSVVTQVTAMNGAVATVSSIGPDANLGYQIGQWIELTDDSYVFGQPPNQSGSLYQIAHIQLSGSQFLVTLSAQITGIDPARNARMRRWDQLGASATTVGIPLSAVPVQLENGIEVTFGAGSYVAGDYWTIPARTASGEIDWPPCGGDGLFFQPAKFTEVYIAPLACIHPLSRQFFDTEENRAAAEGNERFLVDDCRLLFPPLTDLNANAISPALHVQSTSWNNDDVMTVDTLIENGLFLTLDQATTCPWSGANFRVTLETPLANDTLAQYAQNFGAIVAHAGAPDPTDVFLRTEFVLDPPQGILVSGTQVNWLAPATKTGIQFYASYWLYLTLNGLLIAAKTTGYARVRIHLNSGAIYATGAAGNLLYLDGQSFGFTGSRIGDGAECIQLNLPSGNATAASDFEGWFYLAPTVLVGSVVIQGVENGQETTISALKVLVNSNNQVIGFQIGESATVTNLQALVTLTYAPLAPTVVTLSLNGNGAGTVVSIAGSITIPAGQSTGTTPINIPINPGAVTDTVTLVASVSTALGQLPFNPAPTLAITGSTPPPPPIQ